MTARIPDPITAPVAGYHSKTEFIIPAEQADAIIRTSSYHRTDFERAVIWFKPGTHPSSMISSTAVRQSTTSLGELDRLPLELINAICLQLDIASLFRMRQVSLRARVVVNAIHEYQVMTANARDAFCALLRTRSASRVTLMSFYELLCTQSCSLCGHEYGDIVFLPEWFRCCSSCVRRGAPHVATLASVTRVLRSVYDHSLHEFPTLRTLPGIYTMAERLRSSRMTVVSSRAVSRGFQEVHLGKTSTKGLREPLNAQPILTFMACCSLPTYDPSQCQIETGISCAGCQLAYEDGISVDGGEWGGDAADMVYSRSGFLKHFVRCEQAQKLWISSRDGTIEPSKMPHMCKIGGYFNPRL